MVASLFVASLCLVMLLSIQAMLRSDLGAAFGTVGGHVTRAACYVLMAVFIVAFGVETGRLLVNA
jgi:hypothetical protein